MNDRDPGGKRPLDSAYAYGILVDVFWKRLDTCGLEHCRLIADEGGYRLEGIVLVAQAAEAPSKVDYVVRCDPTWVTREVQVTTIRPTGRAHLELRRDESGAWWRDGERLAGMDGLFDIDLSLKPSTNTLPIRRLGLAEGGIGPDRCRLGALPGALIERLPQRYARTGPRAYRYESRGGAFTADLTVDDHGLVVRYAHIWERIGHWRSDAHGIAVGSTGRRPPSRGWRRPSVWLALRTGV